MIHHIVLIRFRPDIAADEIEALFAEIAAVAPQVPGMGRVTSGVTLGLEPLDKGFRHGFVVEFKDRAALAAYQANPDHRATGARMVEAAQGGLDGILVFDLES